MRGSDLTFKQTGLSTVTGRLKEQRMEAQSPGRAKMAMHLESAATGKHQEGGVREEHLLLSGAAAQH